MSAVTSRGATELSEQPSATRRDCFTSPDPRFVSSLQPPTRLFEWRAMPLLRVLNRTSCQPITEVSFADTGIRERDHLQAMLRDVLRSRGRLNRRGRFRHLHTVSPCLTPP